MMKQDYIFSFANLYTQYLECRKHKRKTYNALKFEVNAEENLFDLCHELQSGTYKPGRSICFVVEKPKMREIIAADFRDRVVHHVLIDRLEAIFEPVFIHDSYACRNNKGVHKAIERVRDFIQRLRGSGRNIYFLKLDIKNFFINIDKNILLSQVYKKVRDKNLRYLAQVVIMHNSADNYLMRGDKDLINRLPEHKSLLKSAPDKGLPIGNLTSQFFGNLYLNELDQYVKHTLKCKYYVRYCDDSLLLGSNKEQLQEFKLKIEQFLMQRLKLNLNDKYGQVLPLSNGIDFLGYVIRHEYMLVRRRVILALKTKLNQFEESLVHQLKIADIPIKVYHYNYSALEQLRAVVASYMGHLAKADSWRLRVAIFRKYQFLSEYFNSRVFLSKNSLGKLQPLFECPKLLPSVKSQYNYFTKKFPGCTLLFQVGKFCEFYAPPDKQVISVLNLKPLKQRQRGALYGFPLHLVREYCNKLLIAHIPVVIIRESGRCYTRVKERLPSLKVVVKKEDEKC